MANEYMFNNPLDVAREIFARLKEQVVDISCNINLIVVALENKFGIREFRGSN